ncbi:hypothetical protein Tco_1108735 [Tanacetum coccineum]
MTLSLAKNVIVAGVDNRPPMLEKTNYNSWAIRMLLYIKSKENGDLLVDSVLNEPFQLGTIEVPRNANTPATIRERTHADLTEEEKLRASVDIKATNIVLQETIHSYYMRFAPLINDMHTIGMTMQTLQVNTKFVNHLPPEWGKFVTDVKLLKDMHTMNFDHLYAHLRQHESHANEVRLNRQHYSDPVALVANSSSCLNPTQYYPQMTISTHIPVHVHQSYQAPALQQSYQAPPVHQVYQAPALQQSYQQTFHSTNVHQPAPQSFPQLDSVLAVPSFHPTDDPIESLNKAMAFISTTFASPFPQTNNQLRTSSNPRNQETIQDGKEIPSLAAFQTDDLDAFDSDCDDAPSAKAVLMANLSSYDSHVLSEVQNHDMNIESDISYQTMQETQCSEQPFFNNDTDIDITSDNNIISYEQYLQETETSIVQSTSSTAQQDELLMFVIDEINAKVADFEKQIHSLKLQLNATTESHKTLSTTIKMLKEASKHKEDKYLDEIIDLQKDKKALDNVVYKMGQSTQTMHMLTKPQVFYDECHKMALGYQNPFYLTQARRKVPALYDGHTIVKKHDALTVTDTEETLELAEESRLKMLAKQNDETMKEKKVNFAHVDYVALNKLSEHFVKHFVPQK